MGIPWKNSDGLHVRFDTDRLIPVTYRGEDQGAGPKRYLDFAVDCLQLVNGVVYDITGLIIPRNFFVTNVEYTVEAAITGTTGITIGTRDLKDANVVATNLLSSLTALTIGNEQNIIKGGSGAGALIGTNTTVPLRVQLTPTGTGTGGLLSVRIAGFVGTKDANPTSF